MAAHRESDRFKQLLEVMRSVIGPSVVTQATGLVIAFAAQVVIARAIGAADFGMFSFSLAVASGAAIVGRFGWDSTILRFGAQLAPESLGRLVRVATGSAWRVSAAAMILTLAAWVFTVRYGRASASYQEIAACAALIPLIAQSGIFQAVLIVEGNLWRALSPEYLLRPLLLLIGGTLLFGFRAPGAEHALIVAIASVGAALLTGRWLARSYLQNAFAVNDAGDGQDKQWAANSRATIQFNGAYQLLAYSDMLIAGLILPLQELGHYSAARALAALGMLALVSMQVPIGPRIAIALKNGDLSGARSLIAIVTRLSALFAGAFGIVAIGLGTTLLSAFGPDFESASSALLILALAHLLNATAGPIGSVVTMSGLQGPAARVYVFAALVLVTVAMSVAPTLGATGIACAYLISTSFWTIALNSKIRRELGISTWLMSRGAHSSSAGRVQ